MKKIIIVGYPKSGNTWLTRLVAELVNCPVAGFLYSGHYEIAVEGQDRISEYACFKSHHQLHELNSIDRKDSKIIYVIRDPRDVSISGRRYFYKKLIPFDPHRTSIIPKTLYRIINKIHKITLGDYRIKKLMNEALLHGNSKVHKWCAKSWKDHVLPYLNERTILKITYENTLANPEKVCTEILSFLEMERKNKEIKKAIENQSFNKVKAKFKETNQKNKANFLKKGSAHQWKSKMTQKEKDIFTNELEKLLRKFNYDLN